MTILALLYKQAFSVKRDFKIKEKKASANSLIGKLCL